MEVPTQKKRKPRRDRVKRKRQLENMKKAREAKLRAQETQPDQESVLGEAAGEEAFQSDDSTSPSCHGYAIVEEKDSEKCKYKLCSYTCIKVFW